MKDSKDTRLAILFNRLLRWGFGALFITIGIQYFEEGGWPAILFGVIFLITGFFRPARCLVEGCELKTIK